ncbi:Mitochondrial pyruvate carrier 1 [Labeo rohita]|uniref:Mitochondrial pyruvate carrier 1 n=1 Tax=Labeo rohita TaxID=84645 RepID=A0ABQ8LUD4_LABRO|nr:Mitochondrial pyruvate carrier 1 [Labeo rohita]
MGGYMSPLSPVEITPLNKATADFPESSQVTTDLYESSLALAVHPEPCHVSAVCPESGNVSADRPDPRHVSSDLLESCHVIAVNLESRFVSAVRPESHYILAEHPESCHATEDHPESCHVLYVASRFSRSVLLYPSLVSSVRDAPLVISHIGVAFWCVWAAFSTTEVSEPATSMEGLPKAATEAAEPPEVAVPIPDPTEVAAYAAEPPEAASFTSALVLVVAPINELPVRPVTAIEAACELSSCSEPAKEAISELFSHSEPAMEADYELSAQRPTLALITLPVMNPETKDAVYICPVTSVSAKETTNELSTYPVPGGREYYVCVVYLYFS